MQCDAIFSKQEHFFKILHDNAERHTFLASVHKLVEFSWDTVSRNVEESVL